MRTALAVIGVGGQSSYDRRMRRCVLLLALIGCASTPKTLSLDAARDAHRAGDDATAYPKFAEALCREDKSLATARGLVESWVALGKPGTASQHVRECKLPPVVMAYIAGLEAAAMGTPQPALQSLDDALAAASSAGDRAEIGYRAGLVRLESGDFDGAITSLREASGNDTQRVDVRLGLAQAQSQARLYAECVTTLRGILAIELTANDLDRARRVLRGAIRGAEDPLPAEARAELQDLLTVAERGAVDEHHIVRARELLSQHHHASVLTVLGVLAMRAGDVANGATALNEAAKLAPLDPDPPRALGFAFFASDRASLALGPLREAARRDPFDIQSRAMLAETASKLGETAIALEAYKALTVLAANRSDNYLWVARLERKQSRLEAARTAALKGLAVHKDDIPLLVEHAAIEAQIALTASESRVRREAASRTRDAVDELLVVAPGHPGAEAIRKSVEGI